MSDRAKVEAHVAACRAAMEEGRARPRWTGGSLFGADLSGADLAGANFHQVDLFNANLSGANLSKANLSSPNLSKANLTGTNLSGAFLRLAWLNRAKLINADLTGANLSYASMLGTDLTGAQLTGASLEDMVVTGPAILEHSATKGWWAVATEKGILLYYRDRSRLLSVWEAEVYQGSYTMPDWKGLAAAMTKAATLAAGVRR